MEEKNKSSITDYAISLMLSLVKMKRDMAPIMSIYGQNSGFNIRRELFNKLKKSRWHGDFKKNCTL